MHDDEVGMAMLKKTRSEFTTVTLGSGTNTTKNGGFCLHFRRQLRPGIPCLTSADFGDYPSLTFSRIAGNPRQTRLSTAFQFRIVFVLHFDNCSFHFRALDSGPKLGHLYSPLLKAHSHGEHLSLSSFPFINFSVALPSIVAHFLYILCCVVDSYSTLFSNGDVAGYAKPRGVRTRNPGRDYFTPIIRVRRYWNAGFTHLFWYGNHCPGPGKAPQIQGHTSSSFHVEIPRVELCYILCSIHISVLMQFTYSYNSYNSAMPLR
jgi:hypothetical protein